MRERITKRVEKIFYMKETHKFITLKDMKSTKVRYYYLQKIRVKGEITRAKSLKRLLRSLQHHRYWKGSES